MITREVTGDDPVEEAVTEDSCDEGIEEGSDRETWACEETITVADVAARVPVTSLKLGMAVDVFTDKVDTTLD